MAFKKITTNKAVYRVVLLAFGVFLFGCTSAQAATLQINSSSESLSPGSIATLSVILNSEGTAINNADAKIVFPADLLEVVSVSKGNSIFSLWVEEPSYSNITGAITFNGGIPAPGFTGSYGTALSVVVKAKKAGQADVIFSDAAVRANDGLGTDVLRATTGKTLSIITQEEPLVPEIPTPVSTPSIAALQITSPTHSSQESWYKDNSPIYRWKVPTGVDAVQTAIDNNTLGSPRVTYSPVISEKAVKDLEDGIWYFKVRARKDGAWGPTSTYIARVDTTIPQKNDVAFSYDDATKVLDINADIVDETSGVDYYDIYINGSLLQKVPSEEFVGGNYSLTINTPGDNTIKLVAVDRAGNSIESTGTFKVTAAPEPIQPAPDTNEQLLITIGSFTIPLVYFIIIILLIVIILLLGAFKLGRSYSKIHNKLKVRAALVRGDNTKVLLLLKKRLEKHLEILQNTRHNRILSKEEKEIKEAIEGDLDEVDRAIEKQGAE